MRKILLLFISCLFTTAFVYPQAGIGTEDPDASSLFEVKSLNKGVLLPRVVLTSIDMDLDGETGQEAGLLVYNTGGVLTEGYYFWNGSEWRVFDSSTAVAPAIEELLCASASITPAGYKSSQPYTGNLRVAYTGGNGGSYQPGTPVTVHGLTFTLRAGKLEYGHGELIFSVTGTPDTNNDFQLALTSAEIPFLQSGQECTATITNQTTADISSLAYVGHLSLTNDDGRTGYHWVAHTPDGKWSVRCFVPQGNTFASSNLQLRYNGSDSDPATKDIISNTAQFRGGLGSTQNNQARYPKNQWAGYNGSLATLVTADGQTASNFPSWHTPSVYLGGLPEYRIYTWSEYDPTYKTFYTMEFMMSTTGTPTTLANTSTCPDGTCTGTKVFFYMRQITAP